MPFQIQNKTHATTFYDFPSYVFLRVHTDTHTQRPSLSHTQRHSLSHSHTDTNVFQLTRNNFTSIKSKYDTQTLSTSGRGHKTSECIIGTLMNQLCGFKSIQAFFREKKTRIFTFWGREL